MNFNIGDKVVFIEQTYTKYAWKLKKNKEYTITNRAFDKMGLINYIAVKDKEGIQTCWYLEEDFVKVKELRKEKLTKINQYGN